MEETTGYESVIQYDDETGRKILVASSSLKLDKALKIFGKVYKKVIVKSKPRQPYVS